MVLTGAGDRAFCAGGDLKQRNGMTDEEWQAQHVVFERMARALVHCPIPLIAAINGVARGAGVDMALMCDIRIAARSARFAEAYVRVGLIPGNGGCYFLPRIVGVGKALEMLLTGEFVNAEEALRIGLVNQVFDDENFLESAYAYAGKIAAMPPIAVSMIKRTVYQSLTCDLRTSLELIASQMTIVQTTEDYREAITAFKEKRKGAYKGR